jgi:hypothetical protein
MKRLAMNMTLAVAALAVAAGTVSAQTMKAEIPFAFRVGKQVMQPGEYRVTVKYTNSGSQLLYVATREGDHTVLLAPAYRKDAPKDWTAAGLPKLSFACGEGPCTINRVWTGDGDALNFSTPRGKNGEPHISEIILRPDRAD